MTLQVPGREPATDMKGRRRYLVIVAQNQGKLFEYLRRQLSADPKVEVVLDRRGGDRRHAAASSLTQRRRRERRRPPSGHQDLRFRDVVVVDVAAGPSPETGARPSAPAPGEPAASAAVALDEPAENIDARTRLLRWAADGPRRLGDLARFVEEHRDVWMRTMALETRRERLRRDLALRTENEQLLTERIELLTALTALLGNQPDRVRAVVEVGRLVGGPIPPLTPNSEVRSLLDLIGRLRHASASILQDTRDARKRLETLQAAIRRPPTGGRTASGE